MTNSKRNIYCPALISGGAGPPETSLLNLSACGEGDQIWRRNFFLFISYRILDPEHSDGFSLNHFKTSCPFQLDFRGHTTVAMCPALHKGSGVRSNGHTRLLLLFLVFRIPPLKNSQRASAITFQPQSHLTLISPILKLPSTVTMETKWLLVAPRYLAWRVRSYSL